MLGNIIDRALAFAGCAGAIASGCTAFFGLAPTARAESQAALLAASVLLLAGAWTLGVLWLIGWRKAQLTTPLLDDANKSIAEKTGRVAELEKKLKAVEAEMITIAEDRQNLSEKLDYAAEQAMNDAVETDKLTSELEKWRSASTSCNALVEKTVSAENVCDAIIEALHNIADVRAAGTINPKERTKRISKFLGFLLGAAFAHMERPLGLQYVAVWRPITGKGQAVVEKAAPTVANVDGLKSLVSAHLQAMSDCQNLGLRVSTLVGDDQGRGIATMCFHQDGILRAVYVAVMGTADDLRRSERVVEVFGHVAGDYLAAMEQGSGAARADA